MGARPGRSAGKQPGGPPKLKPAANWKHSATWARSLNPLQRLAELAGEADAVKGLLARKVDELAELATSGKGPGPWFTAFERALDRVAALCAMLSKLDIDQRVVDAAVTAARQYGSQEVPAILDEVFDGLGLDARQRALIPELVRRALESLACAS